MKDFISKVLNFLNKTEKAIELSSEPKIDGISTSLVYENGLLVKGLSRGDGITGEDILENLSTIKTIPKNYRQKTFRFLEIRGEILYWKRRF